MVNRQKYMADIRDANLVTGALVNNPGWATQSAQKIILGRLKGIKHHGAVAKIVNSRSVSLLAPDVQKKAREFNYHFLLANEKHELPPAPMPNNAKIIRK